MNRTSYTQRVLDVSRYVGDCAGDGYRPDADGELLTPLGGKTLRVVEPRDPSTRWKNHSRCGDRTCERSTADLVDAGYVDPALRAQALLESVQCVKALGFALTTGKEPAGGANRVADACARIGCMMRDQSRQLVVARPREQ
jgi:hypothetical protein